MKKGVSHGQRIEQTWKVNGRGEEESEESRVENNVLGVECLRGKLDFKNFCCPFEMDSPLEFYRKMLVDIHITF